MKKPVEIALHTNELDTFGVDVLPMQKADESLHEAHRDDHYMLIIQQKGMTEFEIDYTAVRIKGASLCFVTPGQVHRYFKRTNLSGWYVFIDTSLVPDQYREIFDTYQHFRQVVDIDKDDLLFAGTLLLAQLLNQEPHVLTRSIVASQVHALVGMAVARILQSSPAAHPVNGQPYNIAKQFKQLIRANFKTIKQVQHYASALNITPLYLNEVIREITGFTASSWIQQEILIEAQRMLVYTALDVKQIAWELGYEDHTYFSRFFKKHTGMTALEFRFKNHDMSNHPH